mgnify:CR=1 FL=1
MDLAILLFRTLLMYFFVLVMLRLMGKREIGRLSVFDLVISIMIAEIAALAIEPDRPLLHSIAPVTLLVLTQMGLAYLSLKNRRLRLLIDGRPSVLISDGKMNRREMQKQRYTLDDLAIQLRENQIVSADDVQLAVLEPSGRLSVIPKDAGKSGGGGEAAGQRPASPEASSSAAVSADLSSSSGTASSAPANAAGSAAARQRDNTRRPDAGRKGDAAARPKFRYELLPVPLIMDGKVQDDNLQRIGKTRFWLKRELKRHGVSRFGDVFYCSVDHRGKLYVDKKD